MIKLQHPVKLIKNLLVFREIWNKEARGEEIMLEDKLRFYEAKANIFSKRAIDSGGREGIDLMKSLGAIKAYDDMDFDNPYRFV